MVLWIGKFIICLHITLMIDMTYGYSGKCPYFPNVELRDNSCFEKDVCVTDQDCPLTTQKCCENPCGVFRCYVTDVQAMEKQEKCPDLTDDEEEDEAPPSYCKREPTFFCFKNDLQRWCYAENSCNPSPEALDETSVCEKAICSNHTCKQGSICHVDKTSRKPYCECLKSCYKEQRYVCGLSESKPNLPKTYFNKCHLDKKACEKNEKIKIINKGRCNKTKDIVKSKPQKPMIENVFVKADLGKSLSIRCLSDRKGLKPVWYKRKDDNTETVMPTKFQEEMGAWNIDGKVREVVFLSIEKIGHGSFGTYACRIKFDRTTLESLVHVISNEGVPFKTSDCLLQVDSGATECSGTFTNYYYEKASRSCQSFTYKGCGGNGNNFQTKEECEVKCLNKRPDDKKKLIHHGEPCNNTELCEYYAECKSNQCMCPKRCPFAPKPVCGSDGRTYLTLCSLKHNACKWRKPIVALYKGKCKFERKDDAQALVGSTKPPSLCDIRKCGPYATCFIHPFTGIPTCRCRGSCPFKPNIVCASNNQHFLNHCFLEAKSCQLGRKLHVLRKGLCF